MRCPSCTPDYCACADFYGGRLKYWKGEMMTDKPTAPDLVALSAAATQGKCATCAKLTADMEHTAARLAAQMGGKMVCRECAREYRAGRLVQIDEGMRERVARAMCRSFECQENVPAVRCAKRCSVPTECVLDVFGQAADAAIAAIMGGVK